MAVEFVTTVSMLKTDLLAELTRRVAAAQVRMQNAGTVRESARIAGEISAMNEFASFIGMLRIDQNGEPKW